MELGDITWLRAPIQGLYFYLYMMMDIYSRKIVGWEVHPVENADLGAELLHKTVLSEGCVLKPLTLHSDNGSPQKGFTMKAKMEALDVTASYSRPRVSNDNPYSESLFRTTKYRPDYPGDFASIEAARQWVSEFVRWYNEAHLHSALRFITPSCRHQRRDLQILAQRKHVYEKARARHPDRWSGEIRKLGVCRRSLA
ncbi:integrase core domain-containing protein [Desulfosarcina sp. OttesenSCG-928-B08]|nr:integrase core domain-containing protein [Desulfosarcina sp. OttesenSCG-928-B08]